MHSIRTKFLLLICGSVLGIFFALAAISMHYVQKVVEQDYTSTLTLSAQQISEKLDVRFQGVERAVAILGEYLVENTDTEKLENDSTYRQFFWDNTAQFGSGEARVAGDVLALYFYPNPSVYGRKSGILMKNSGEGKYERLEPMDIKKYSQNDIENVGWYYEPVKNQEAMWLEPYSSEYLEADVISYVEPVYIADKLLGVVGMDIDLSEVRSIVDSMIYEKGYGFIVNENGNLIYHRDYPKGLKHTFFDENFQMIETLIAKDSSGRTIRRYQTKGREYRLIASHLENDMIFAISVPEKDLVQQRTRMGRNMILVLVFALVVILFVAWRVMIWIVRPIRELTAASSRIARGELNTPINYQSKDEIGKLADSIRMTAKELQEYISYIRAQAYTDAMTGVRNKTAYIDLIKLMDKKIQEDMADFSVAVFDVNGLKRMNDNFGHEQGDMLITDAASVLKKIFGEDRVYRIGGDEFIVVAESVTEQEMTEFFARYDKLVEEFNVENDKYSDPLSMSKGAAYYVRQSDREYNEVFKRADEAMYRDKASYYQGRNDRRRS